MGEVNVAVRRSHQTQEAQSAERLQVGSHYDENHGSANGPSSRLRERHV